MTNPVINNYKDKIWYKNGKIHRENGPAIEYASGSKHWYKNGRLHREDGPAIETALGDTFWYLNGEKFDPIVWLLKLHELRQDFG